MYSIHPPNNNNFVVYEDSNKISLMQGADALITELLDSSQCGLKCSIKAVLHQWQ
jgi:hypothetical protein